jgi:hypothetical protein
MVNQLWQHNELIIIFEREQKSKKLLKCKVQPNKGDRLAMSYQAGTILENK